MKIAILLLLAVGLVSLGGCANDDHAHSTTTTTSTTSYGK